jgi:hypothetical protein
MRQSGLTIVNGDQGREQIGNATDDWGVFIGRQLARLAAEKELSIKFLEPQTHDESLAVDVFDDGFHILGIVHGHQAKRPDMMATWWRGQAFGRQPVADASLLVSTAIGTTFRVTELGSAHREARHALSSWPRLWTTVRAGGGRSRAKTRCPVLLRLILEKGVDYTGTVFKL